MILIDCWNFQVKQNGKGEIVCKICKVVESYYHTYEDKHHLSMGVNQAKSSRVDVGKCQRDVLEVKTCILPLLAI